MKKLLLSMVAMATCGLVMNAAIDPTVIEFKTGSTDYPGVSSYTSTWKSKDGFWSFSALNNNNCGWAFIAGGSKSADTTPTIATCEASAAPIESFVATLSTRYTKSAISKVELYVADNAEFTGASVTDVTSSLPSAASSDMTINVSDAPEGSFVKVVMTVPKQSSNGQAVSFAKITINYGEAGGQTLEPAGLEFDGSIVAVGDGNLDAFEAPALTNPHNLDLTWTSSDENVAEVAADGKVTLNGDCGKAVITASFAGDDTYKAAKVSYTVYVAKTVSSVADVKALTAGTMCYIDFAVTVGYRAYNNVFVCDAAGDFIQFYGSNNLAIGDRLPAGYVMNYTVYQTYTPELEVKEYTVLPAAEAGTYTPAEANPANLTTADVNKVVLIKNVVIAAATPSDKNNFTGTVDGTDYTFRNNYTLPSVAAGTYDVTVVVSVYSGAVQLYVTEFAQTSGIEAIEAETAPAVYYNLQGVEVANPENGRVYIVRRGSKVSKAVL